MMNKLLIIFSTLLFVTGCSTSMKSVEGDSTNKKYDTPLVVIPYSTATEKFNYRLMLALEFVAEGRGQEVDIQMIESIQLDEVSEILEIIKSNRVTGIVAENSNDLILTFTRAKHGHFSSKLSFLITAYDPELNEIVWSGNLTSDNVFMLNATSKKIAKMFYYRLDSDGVL